MLALATVEARPTQPHLVLASSSPRRRELLAGLGLAFDIIAPDVDESTPDHLPDSAAIEAWVLDLARAKAADVARRAPAGAWILGADTVVVLETTPLGKPADEADALAMLEQLQGRTHTVLTAVALHRAGAPSTTTAEVAATRVTFFPCTSAELTAYVATGECLDKAGAYAAQGRGALIIERLDGDYFNVVGLPLAVVGRLLAGVGFDLWAAGAGAGQ